MLRTVGGECGWGENRHARHTKGWRDLMRAPDGRPADVLHDHAHRRVTTGRSGARPDRESTEGGPVDERKRERKKPRQRRSSSRIRAGGARTDDGAGPRRRWQKKRLPARVVRRAATPGISAGGHDQHERQPASSRRLVSVNQRPQRSPLTPRMHQECRGRGSPTAEPRRTPWPRQPEVSEDRPHRTQQLPSVRREGASASPLQQPDPRAGAPPATSARAKSLAAIAAATAAPQRHRDDRRTRDRITNSMQSRERSPQCPQEVRQLMRDVSSLSQATKRSMDRFRRSTPVPTGTQRTRPCRSASRAGPSGVGREISRRRECSAEKRT